MTMQTTLGVIGGVVGAFFGYPQLGFLVGSLIGAALTPGTKTEGPKLDDLKVTVSTYGVGIAILYGTMRMGGNVIFSTDKIDVATTESQGKGGGNETTTHSYFVHMATALCEGPITAVRKRWFDGALKYDQSSGIPIASALASASSPYATATVYLGTDSQLPDPTMESIKGVGHVPAYLNTAYVMDTWLETPGGRIPQGTFEVTTDSNAAPEVSQLVTVPVVTNDLYAGVCQPNGVWHSYWQSSGFGFPTSFTVYYGETSGQVQAVRNFQLPESNAYQPYPVFCATEALWLWPNGGAPGLTARLDVIDANSGVRNTVYQGDAGSCPGYYVGRAAYDPVEKLFIVLSLGDPDFPQPLIFNRFNGVPISVAPVSGIPFQVGIGGGVAYVLTDDGGVLKLARRFTNGTIDASMPDTIGPTFGMNSLALQFSCLCVNEFGIFALILSGSPNITARSIYKINPATATDPGSWALLYTGSALAIENIFSGPASRTFYCSNEMAVVGPVPASDDYKAIRFAALNVSPYPVADILADQCRRAGVDLDHVDVSGIDDEVIGYVIKNPGSARANIDPLLMAYGIDVREQDGKIQFIKRADQVSVATIPYVDLASHDASEEPGDPMPLTHQQEVECPKTVSVSFLNYLDDYQTATESYTGQVTTSEKVTTIELPLALTPDEGATIAFRLWCDAWNARNARSLKLQRKYLALSPGDVATVEYPEGSLSDWRLTKITDTGSLLECEAVPADSALYSQTAVGATSYSGGQEVPAQPSNTRLTLADAPIFRDEDSNGGIYACMEGFGPGWNGATLWVGEDDTSLQDRGTVSNVCATGFAEDALGTWSPRMIDGANSVIVTMGDDVLASITNDQLMTTRANLALLGTNGRWEAIQFQRADDLGSGRYRLYGLLRGLFGTERNRGTHAIGDTFLLLAGVSGILRPSMGASEIGQNKSYRAVSLGRDMNATASVVYANTAEGLRPYAPWDARKSKAASNDQAITWERRTRFASNALRGIVPLGETTEAYRIRLYTSSAFTTVATTKTSTSRTATFTSAEQTAAGLTPGGTLWVGISQVSDTYGAGSELQATL